MRIAALALFTIALLSCALRVGAARAESALCANPSAFCGQIVTTDCLQRLGAGAQAAREVGADCPAQLDAYAECVALAAECAPPEPAAQEAAPQKAAADGCGEQAARELWTLAETDDNCAGYAAFLKACPDAPRAAFASARLETMGCEAGGGPTATERFAARLRGSWEGEYECSPGGEGRATYVISGGAEALVVESKYRHGLLRGVIRYDVESLSPESRQLVLSATAFPRLTRSRYVVTLTLDPSGQRMSGRYLGQLDCAMSDLRRAP